MQQVHFSYHETDWRLKQAGRIKAFIPTVFKREKIELAHVQFIFCTDDFLLQINRQFLNHDYYTDIITFPLSAKGKPVEAEIYISVERVKENAKQFGSTIEKEMQRIIIHGALHLCGYSDKSAARKKEMTAKEDEYLGRLPHL